MNRLPMTKKPTKFTEPVPPSDAVMALWPDASGNDINGLGETEFHQPRPVFWRQDDSTPHSPVMYYFYERSAESPELMRSREYRKRTQAIPINDISDQVVSKSPEEWTAALKAAALEIGADDVGICEWTHDWAFPDRPAPKGKYAVVMAFAHYYDNLSPAPSDATYIEVMAQYERAGSTAKHLANWIRDRGHPADGKTGPMTDDVLMIPPAIEAGLGELGKHGSMLHRKFGANFRLSMVLTDLPLVPDKPDVFGGDMFCESCQICSNACPPDAIFREKQTVRGTKKWYVDFDKCLPYFVDNKSCGICLAVCPWSRPGIGENLLGKMAKRMAALEAAEG